MLHFAGDISLTDPTVLPTVPSILIVLINLLAPYAISIVTASFWPKNVKKAVAVVVSILLSAIVIVLAHFGFGLALPAWPQLLILGILTSQTSYGIFLKDNADALTKLSGVGAGQTVVTTAVEKSVQVLPAAGSTVVVNSTAPVSTPDPAAVVPQG